MTGERRSIGRGRSRVKGDGVPAPTAAGFRLERVAGCWIVRCDALSEVSGVGHAFSTRRDGHGDDAGEFDLGAASTREAAVLSRRRRLCVAAGLGDREPLAPRQVHGTRLLELGPRAPERRFDETADGIVAVDPLGAPPLAVRAADCVPLLLAEASGRALAAVHAGWRGAAAGIPLHAVRRLQVSGIAPESLLAALGPAIGPCCYEVGREVVVALARAARVSPERLASPTSGTRATLDLRAAVALQLIGAGLDPAAIAVAPWCTACDAERFFSYRREGARAGRMMAVIGWRPGAGGSGGPFP